MQIPKLLFSSGARRGTTARIFLALFSIITLAMLIGGAALAFSIMGNGLTSTHAQQAAGVTFQDFYIPSSDDPWGTAFDSKGNVWLAIPGCDPSPTCSSSTPPGEIAEFNPATSNWIATYQLPAGYAQPLFLAFDAQGRLWFPMPMDNSIGMFNPSNKMFQQWAVPTPGAGPWDVAVDHQGMIWFTEHYVNKIGRFDPGAQTFMEVATPASNSQPYGIVVDAFNNIWFTENNSSVARIGEYTSAGTLQEYKIRNTVQSGLTPHMITVDPNGNVWWTEGWLGMIGELKLALAVPGTDNGVSEYAYQRVCSTCGTHTSGISVDSNGLVWFDDLGQEIFGSFPDSGSGLFTTYSVLAANAHPNDGLNVDAQNRIWFDEEFSNKLGEAVQNNIPTSTPTPGSSPTPSPSPTPTPPPSPSPTPTPPPSPGQPVSKLWYFGEGRVGAGFTEWLTLGNPTGTDCQATVQYFSTPDGGSPHSTSLTVSVPKDTRVTRLVNQDLGISATGGGNSVSATVDVGTSCPGIVAERPIYNTTFGNPLGVNSGTDVIGATHTGTSFYFADVRTGNQNGGSVSSFIPILNNGTTTANVTATYFVGGKQVGQQQTTAVPPGTRGTIYPDTAGLPAHVAAHVTSDQPVLIERPSYFNRVSEGNAGTVSGEADVVGVQQPSNDFLFAEGYTGGQFQEDLVLANFGTSTISGGMLVLEYDTGATYSFPVTIAAQDQTTFDLNQLTGNPASHGGTCTSAATTCKTSQEVSLEVSAGAGFVAEREMYFHYSHTTNYGRSLATQGVSDVLGQVGPAAASAYSFAEGYTNAGYDEWLTLQNPTGNAETITITLANAKGTVYPFPVTILAHSRYTVDIVATVIGHLYHNGDGYQGYEVSMALQSSSGPFVAERPMYWNASGTQGGDDVLGYIGN